MLWTLVIVLAVLWLVGFAFDVLGGVIHLLLIAAVVLVIANLIRGRRTV